MQINKTPVSALSHEQMVELQKTSMSVTVTVIPPPPDGSPRRGCNLQVTLCVTRLADLFLFGLLLRHITPV